MENDVDVENLRTVYAIVALQEAGWIGAPLIVTANVLVHAFLSPLDTTSCVVISTIFAFFLLTGILLVISLLLLHKYALDQQRRAFLLPYLIVKLVRTFTLAAVSVYIIVVPNLRRHYFYIPIYGLFECTASLVSAEIVFRSWQAIRRSCNRRRLAPVSSTRVGLLRPPSLRSTQSEPG